MGGVCLSVEGGRGFWERLPNIYKKLKEEFK